MFVSGEKLQLPEISLPVSGLDLWWIPVPQIDAGSLLQVYPDCLSSEEHQRLRSRSVAKGQRQFVFTRVMLRHLLSAYHPELSPGQWLIGRTASGRPHLSRKQSQLSFNLTHSDDCLIIAFSQYAEPGIDLELLSREADVEGIAKRFFSGDEYAQLQQCSSVVRDEFFYRLWTLKEAAVKASGLGLAKGLRQFEFSQPGTGRFTHSTRCAAFSFWSARVDSAVVAAALMHRGTVPVPGITPVSRYFQWPDTVKDIYPDWDRSQSRNSSTNLEP